MALRICVIPIYVLLVVYFILSKFNKHLRLYDEKYPFAGQCTEINDLFLNNETINDTGLTNYAYWASLD